MNAGPGSYVEITIPWMIGEDGYTSNITAHCPIVCVLQETQAVHMNAGPGSYVEITIPWMIGEDGYTSNITGQLLHLDATTSLQFRSLLETERLEVGKYMY